MTRAPQQASASAPSLDDSDTREGDTTFTCYAAWVREADQHTSHVLRGLDHHFQTTPSCPSDASDSFVLAVVNGHPIGYGGVK